MALRIFATRLSKEGSEGAAESSTITWRTVKSAFTSSTRREEILPHSIDLRKSMLQTAAAKLSVSVMAAIVPIQFARWNNRWSLI